jgi:hypothetical protein
MPPRGRERRRVGRWHPATHRPCPLWARMQVRAQVRAQAQKRSLTAAPAWSHPPRQPFPPWRRPAAPQPRSHPMAVGQRAVLVAREVAVVRRWDAVASAQGPRQVEGVPDHSAAVAAPRPTGLGGGGGREWGGGRSRRQLQVSQTALVRALRPAAAQWEVPPRRLTVRAPATAQEPARLLRCSKPDVRVGQPRVALLALPPRELGRVRPIATSGVPPSPPCCHLPRSRWPQPPHPRRAAPPRWAVAPTLRPHLRQPQQAHRQLPGARRRQLPWMPRPLPRPA